MNIKTKAATYTVAGLMSIFAAKEAVPLARKASPALDKYLYRTEINFKRFLFLEPPMDAFEKVNIKTDAVKTDFWAKVKKDSILQEKTKKLLAKHFKQDEAQNMLRSATETFRTSEEKQLFLAEIIEHNSKRKDKLSGFTMRQVLHSYYGAYESEVACQADMNRNKKFLLNIVSATDKNGKNYSEEVVFTLSSYIKSTTDIGPKELINSLVTHRYKETDLMPVLNATKSNYSKIQLKKLDFASRLVEKEVPAEKIVKALDKMKFDPFGRLEKY